jgi:hypothetical protein
VNVPVFCPEATVTEDGTEAAGLPLESETNVPPGPAGPLKATVPVELLPPATVVGFRLKETRAAGVIVRIADWV